MSCSAIYLDHFGNLTCKKCFYSVVNRQFIFLDGHLGQFKVKQLKNRFGDPAINRAFMIGVDRSKMRLFDVDASAQNIVDSNQSAEPQETPEQAYEKFSDFKL